MYCTRSRSIFSCSSIFVPSRTGTHTHLYVRCEYVCSPSRRRRRNKEARERKRIFNCQITNITCDLVLGLVIISILYPVTADISLILHLSQRVAIPCDKMVFTASHQTGIITSSKVDPITHIQDTIDG